jgi:calcineurin-like phosphoesterase family protein
LSWNKDRPGYWLDRIKCKNLFIVWGNHDKPLRKNRQLVAKRFRAAGDILKVNEGSGIILCHYALRTWDQSHRGRYHLYGHSHGSLPDDETMLSFDVGVDCTNFFPLNFDEVKDRMASKKWGQKL